MDIFTLSKRLLFISLIINISIGNQQLMFGPINFGILFTWLAILCSIIIMFNTLKNRFLTISLVSFIILFRILETISPTFFTLYFLSVGLLYLFAGYIIFTQNINMIYKQIMIIVFINIFFQFAQLLGVWEWPYFFTTFGEYNPGDVIFVEMNNLNINKSQLRPSGIFASPIYQSLITTFATSLHFTRHTNRIPLASIAIILMIILSNSKYPVLGFAIISLIVLLRGTHNQKYFIIKSIMIYIFLLTIYSIIFPGVFNMTLNIRYFAWSFFVRFNNIIQILYPNQDAPLIIQLFTIDTPKAHWHKSGGYIASGYALLAQYKSFLIYFIPIIIGLLYKYIKSVKSLIRINPINKMLFPLACGVITITYPAMFDIFKNPFYWLITGGTLIPLLMNYMKNSIYISKSFNLY